MKYYIPAKCRDGNMEKKLKGKTRIATENFGKDKEKRLKSKKMIWSNL